MQQTQHPVNRSTRFTRDHSIAVYRVTTGTTNQEIPGSLHQETGKTTGHIADFACTLNQLLVLLSLLLCLAFFKVAFFPSILVIGVHVSGA